MCHFHQGRSGINFSYTKSAPSLSLCALERERERNSARCTGICNTLVTRDEEHNCVHRMNLFGSGFNASLEVMSCSCNASEIHCWSLSMWSTA